MISWKALLGGSAIAMALCLVCAPGCSGRFRYCLRLRTGSDLQGLRAEQCNRDCLRGHSQADRRYVQCLHACPGVVVTQNDRCGPQDVGPGKICQATDLDLDAPAADAPGVGEIAKAAADEALNVADQHAAVRARIGEHAVQDLTPMDSSPTSASPFRHARKPRGTDAAVLHEPSDGGAPGDASDDG